MGRIYLARTVGPVGFDKLVALKCIHPDLSSQGAFVEMFFDEARIAARIAHPNVCGVFDFGEADGRYYLAMDSSPARRSRGSPAISYGAGSTSPTMT